MMSKRDFKGRFIQGNKSAVGYGAPIGNKNSHGNGGANRGKHFKHKSNENYKGNQNAFGNKHTPEGNKKISDTNTGNQYAVGYGKPLKYFGKDREIYLNELQTHCSLEYRKWRDAVLKRDDYICQVCGLTSNIAHHIREWAQYPKLRFDVDNGVCLCKQCHDSIRGREESIEMFFMLNQVMKL